jgi:heme exporter protein D
MQFDNISAFLNMGGYAFYVWLSYGVSAFLIVILVLSSKANNRKVIKKIAQRQKRELKLRQAAKLQIDKNTIKFPEEES